MGDFSVSVKISNHTNVALHNPVYEAAHGEWRNVPGRIDAGGESQWFLLHDNFGFYGADGTLKYEIGQSTWSPHPVLSTWQACPWGANYNHAQVETPKPEAVFDVSFEGSIGENGPWLNNAVPRSGHPLYVHYIIKHQSRRFTFRIMRISTRSDHPVRNSRDELIIGEHRVWEYSNYFLDGDKGSLQPNVYKYNFSSQVASSSALTVTIQIYDPRLLGAECILYGLLGNRRIMQSDFFYIIKTGETPVTVHVIDPHTSTVPFSWNTVIRWEMQLRVTTFTVECTIPNTTRLELYWVAEQLHPSFERGFPIGFLRDSVLPHTPSIGRILNSQWHGDMTRHVWGHYNKVYDTISGAAAFGVGAWGGIFNQAYYRAPSPHTPGTPGTLYRHVNCMDQAAILELSFSLLNGPRTSWLVQKPFGFINAAHLVGVTVANQGLILVNNPFFGTDWERSNVDIHDRGRTSFGVHVYNGHSFPLNLVGDGIYDVCGGPHVGNENAAAYLQATIDTQTTLYALTGTTFGTVNNIALGDGVTGIDGIPWGPRMALQRYPEDFRKAVSKIITLSTPSASTESLSYANWSQVPEWIKGVLGDHWNVEFSQVTVGDGTANAFWHIGARSDEEDLILRVNVYVESVLGENGALDVPRSTDAVRDRLALVLTCTDRDPEELWVHGELDEYGQYSIQYSNDVAAGHVVVVAGNILVDICGMSSSSALNEYARKLLDHTVNRERSPVTIPHILRGPIRTPRNPDTTLPFDDNANTITIKGVDNRFSLHWELENQISVANATTEGTGILFDRYVVEEGTQSTFVDFGFVTRRLGRHTVKVHFADKTSMMSVSKAFEVDVI